jgi:hypothetical protein
MDNVQSAINIDTKARGIRCRHETGIIEVYLNGRTAQMPFLTVCLIKEEKFERG